MTRLLDAPGRKRLTPFRLVFASRSIGAAAAGLPHSAALDTPRRTCDRAYSTASTTLSRLRTLGRVA